MRFERLILSLFSSSPAQAADFYVTHLGMRVDFDIGWFVSLRHDDHPDLEIALTAADHDSIPADHQVPAGGVAVALVVDDVSRVHEHLVGLGAHIVLPPTDHPWGQRQVLVEGPDGVLIDLVQITTPDPEWLSAQGVTPEGAGLPS